MTLANFRGFEQFELGLEPDISVIAGVTGVGKSGGPRALTVATSVGKPRSSASKVAPLSLVDADVLFGKLVLDLSTSLDLLGAAARVAPLAAAAGW